MAPWGQLTGGNTKALIGTSAPPVVVPAPIPSFTAGATTGYWPFTVTFTDTSTQAVNLTESYYDFGDGTPTRPWVSGEQFDHVYESAGTYTARLYMTNAAGSVNFPVVITVQTAAAPVISISLSTISTVPNVSKTVEFSVSASGGPVIAAVIDFDDGLSQPINLVSNGAATTVQHTYYNVGTYLARVTAQGASQTSATNSQPVSFDPPPMALLAYTLAPDPIQGTTIYVTNTSTGIITSASVDYGDGSPVVAIGLPGTATATISKRYSPSLNGQQVTVTLTAVGPGGQSSPHAEVITIPTSVPPTVVLSEPIYLSGPSAATGAQVRVDTSITGAMTSATLNFGNGTTPVQLPTPLDPYSVVPTTGQFTATYPPNTDGSPDPYTITLTANGLTGPVQATKQVTIPGISPPTANFTYTVGATLPNGITPVTFTFIPTGTVTQASFNPGFGTNVVSGVGPGSQPLTIPYTTAGSFSVTYTVSNAGGSHTKSVTVVIGSVAPVPDFNLSSSSGTPTTPTSKVSVTLTNTSVLFNASITSYTINWGDGTIETFPTLINAAHQYNAVPSGPKNVTLAIVHSGNVTVTSSVRVFTVVKIVPQVTLSLTEGTYSSVNGLTVTANINNNGSEITSQTINWGDGSATQSLTVGQTSVQKTYPAGSYGTKTVTLTSYNSPLTQTDVDTATVTGLPTSPPITISPTLIDFSVINGSQFAITDEAVSASIPLLEADGLLNTSTFAVLTSTDTPIPAQFKVLARWGGLRTDVTKPIKLVQATFLASVPASSPTGIGTKVTYKLRTNATSQLSGNMSITESTTGFDVRPGDGSILQISKNKFSLLNGAWLANGAQQIFSNPTWDVGIGYMSKSGRAPSYIVPATSNIQTVLEEGTPTTGNIKAVIRQTVTLTQGARIVCRWTFIHNQPEAQVEFTLRNLNKFHDADDAENPVTERTQWMGLADPKGLDKYAEFVKYLKVGMQMRTLSFPTVQVGSFASAATNWRNRTINYTTLQPGQNYSLQQYFRNYKNRSGGKNADITNLAGGDPDPGNLLFYKEGLIGAYQMYEGRPNGTEAITNITGTSILSPTSVAGTVSNIVSLTPANAGPWTATLTLNGMTTAGLAVGMAIDATPGTGRLGASARTITQIVNASTLVYQTVNTASAPLAGTVTHMANPPFPSDPESGRYPGGWVVRNSTGLGFILSADTFSERAPKRFEVDKDTGVVRFHILPEGLPGDSMYFDRGNRLGKTTTGGNYLPYLTASTGFTSVVFPSGINPMTGLAYQTEDYVPASYPDRGTVLPAEAKPTTPGTTTGQLSPSGAWSWVGPTSPGATDAHWRLRSGSKPVTSGLPDADEAYTIFGGSWLIQRIRIRLFSTAPSDNVVKQHLDTTINPLIGLAATERYSSTRALTPMPWSPRSTTGSSWDIDRAEQLLRAMVDISATEAVRTSSDVLYNGSLKTYADAGGKTPTVSSGTNRIIRHLGWDNWGDLWGGDDGDSGWSNLSYDTPRWVLMQFLRTQDYRYYSLAKRFIEWQMTRGFIKTANTATFAAGYPYWEQGIGGHGTGGKPAASHAWLGGLTLAYALTGNEHATDSLMYCVPALAMNRPGGDNDRNPSRWLENTAGERIWAHGMHDSMFIYWLYGPINPYEIAGQIFESSYAPVPTHRNTDNKNLLQIIQDGFQNYDDLQSGVKLSTRSVGICPSPFKSAKVPANFIPTSATNTLTFNSTAYTTSSTYLSGAADTAFLKSSGTITVTGTTQAGATQTFTLTGRDYSDNGFLMYYNASSDPGINTFFSIKHFMFLYCMEAMYMMTVVDPNGPKTARAKTLLRRAVNFWKTHIVAERAGTGTVNVPVYVVGTSDRVAAAYANQTQVGNNWTVGQQLGSSGGWLPQGSATPKGIGYFNLDSTFLNVTAVSLGILLSKDEPSHAADYADDVNLFKTLYRTSVRYGTPNAVHPTLANRPVGPSKSLDPAQSSYTAAGTPRDLYMSTSYGVNYYKPLISDASNPIAGAMAPINVMHLCGSNVPKTLGQSVYRGILYGQAAAVKAGIVGDI